MLPQLCSILLVRVIVIAQAVKLTMQVVIRAAGHGIVARRAGFLVFT